MVYVELMKNFYFANPKKQMAFRLISASSAKESWIGTF